MPPLVALIELPLNGGGVLLINGNILTLILVKIMQILEKISIGNEFID